MKKQEFLDELKRHLRVLQDEEQEDIIDEYSQHIEMKIANGLSEEEAIKDFGPIQALAGEILEAYHVKPEYEQENHKNRIRGIAFADGTAKEREGIRLGEIIRSGCAHIGRAGKVWAGKLLWLLCLPVRNGKQLWLRWTEGRGNVPGETEWEKTEEDEAEIVIAEEGNDVEADYILIEEDKVETDERQMEDSGARPLSKAARKKSGPRRHEGWLHRISRTCRRSGSAFLHGTGRLLRWAVMAGLWCCRAAWNGFVLLTSACSVLAGLVFLFLFGTLAVLWIQGYPFTGIVVGCLGAVLCFSSFAVFSSTFFWRKHHE